MRLTQPLVIGSAVTALLQSQSHVLVWVALYLVVQNTLTLMRAMIDTRTFAHITQELSSELVIVSRTGVLDVSRTAARTAFVRELVGFFERDVTAMTGILLMQIGSVVMLSWYDVRLGIGGLLVLAVFFFIGRVHVRRCTQLHLQFNDRVEREVAVIENASPAEIGEHYVDCAQTRVRLSDSSAISAAITEGATAVLVLVALAWQTDPDEATVGSIIAMLRYVTMFAASAASLPMLLQQITRLGDILTRLHNDMNRTR